PLILTLFPLACLFLSIALAFHFGPGYGDTTFESRFSIPALVYDRVGGLKIFGQDCGLTNWFASEPPESLALDNGWLNLFLCDGLLVGGVVMTILSHMFLMIGRTGDPLLCAMACCYAVGGMMEKMVFTSYLDFLPLVYVSLLDKTTPAEKKAAWLVPATALGVVCYVYWPFPPKKASDASYGLVKDIPAPEGFVKAGYPKDSFQEYVRNLPLLAPDTQLEYYDGSPCDSLQYLCHRVVDYPLIDRNEQCADVCMRLWAEYLYRKGSFKKISFVDTRGKTLKYRFGACRQLFDRFLKEVFTWCNTESSRDGNPVKNIAGIEPGDVFVYDAKSRPGSAYGHAVMVASVAVDSLSGRKAVLVLQGSTPACDIHIAGNPDDSLLSPWYIVEPRQEGDPVLRVGNAFFYNEDLRTNN
ncbi:MAG: hypothetical protein J6L98_00590, partial [Bacteroidales bacterium]|nr:hypothetical protein [Bacteroidales bacterium]